MSGIGFANDGSFMAQMMAVQQQGAAVQASSGVAGPAAPPPPVTPPAPKTPPPAAVLSVAEQIAARIAAKAAGGAPTPAPSFYDAGSSSSSSFSSSAGAFGAGGSRGGDDGGRKRKFTEGEARERPSARCGGDAISAECALETLPIAAADDHLLSGKFEGPRVYNRIGNMLPEEELAKYTTKLPGHDKKPKTDEKTAETIVIESSNVGHKLLSKMGWKVGKGLGAKETGKIEPVGAAAKATEKSGILAGDMHGVGSEHTWDLNGDEDVYEQFRKRNMLGYRYRPNPFNNPRQLYY